MERTEPLRGSDRPAAARFSPSLLREATAVLVFALPSVCRQLSAERCDKWGGEAEEADKRRERGRSGDAGEM